MPMIETRRSALAKGAAAVALAAAPSKALAQQGGPGAAMRDLANRWLAALPDEQRRRAHVAFDDPLRRNWSFMHGSRAAPGLPLEAMSGANKDGAMALVASGLSAKGLETARNIMLQQDILRDEWNKGSPDRNRERFSLLVFGAPAPEAAWGWRFEGHHLSLNYTLIGDEVVSVSPSSFSSEPNTVPSGPHQGLVVLPEQESLGRAVFSDLGDTARAGALLRAESYGNILATAGNVGRIGAPSGVPLGDLPQGVVDRLVRLIEVQALDHLPGPLAEAEAARLRVGDLMSARFGWAGPNEAEASMYYRLHGESFVIEFATLRRQPEHHHAVRHDLGQNFGAHVL